MGPFAIPGRYGLRCIRLFKILTPQTMCVFINMRNVIIFIRFIEKSIK